MALIVTALAAVVVPAQAQAGGNIVNNQRAIVWENGFDVKYWDSVNGKHKIASGQEPAISSNGRFVTYISRSGNSNGRVKLYDVRKRENVPLPNSDPNEFFDNNPALNGDGSRIVWNSSGAVGQGQSVYMYDVPTQQFIVLGDPVNVAALDDTDPTLSNDGNLLAFESERTGGFDDVVLANISNPAVPTLINLPNLNTAEPEYDPYMSGDSQTIGYVVGNQFEASVEVYDRMTSTVLSTPKLSQGLDIYDPALNSSGSLITVARQVRDLGDTAVWLYKRASTDFSKPGPLESSIGDSGPGIADPVSIKRRGN